MPFSISTKRVFEAAVEYSRTLKCQYIAPEHIAVGLFTVDDGSAGRVLKRLGANMNLLTAASLTRLKSELAKDGREPSLSSKGSFDASSSNGRTSGSGNAGRTKANLLFLCASSQRNLKADLVNRISEISKKKYS